MVNPLRFTAAEAADYRAQFQEQVEACPKDSNALFAMGLTYLGLKNYELADEHFVKAVQLTPSNPDVYYYTALSMFHHRSVANLSKAEMGRIEEWLHTAVQIQPKRKYLILQMILRQGMSSMGINVDTDKLAPAELMRQARVTAQEEDELLEIEQHVLITDGKTQFLLDKLVNGVEEHRDSGSSPLVAEALSHYNGFCRFVRPDDHEATPDGIRRLCDPAERERFFRSVNEPRVPEKISKPGYFQPLIRMVWTAAVFAVIWLICAIIASACNIADTHDARVETVDQRMEVYEGQKLSRKERQERRELAQAAFERDSVLDADFIRVYYFYRDSARKFHFVPKAVVRQVLTPEEGVELTEEQLAAFPDNTQYFGFRHGFKGIIGLLLVIVPPLLWLLLVVGSFVGRYMTRKDIREQNLANRAAYEQNLQDHRTRPTIVDYLLFCSLFAGPNEHCVVGKGDFVAEALRQARISERDIQNGNGRIFFSAYLTDSDANGVDSVDASKTLRDLVIRVCVAMRDSVVYLHGVWDTAGDSFPIFERQDYLYSSIAYFHDNAAYSSLEVISHSNSKLAEIIYAYGDFPSIFQYQSLDPDDILTYSTTRTSDFDEFYRSLLKMHTDFVKSR